MAISREQFERLKFGDVIIDQTGIKHMVTRGMEIRNNLLTVEVKSEKGAERAIFFIEGQIMDHQLQPIACMNSNEVLFVCR